MKVVQICQLKDLAVMNKLFERGHLPPNVQINLGTVAGIGKCVYGYLTPILLFQKIIFGS